VALARAQFEAGVALATVAADAGLASSRSEARRLAQGGGLRVNDVVETDGQRVLTVSDLNADGVVKLAAGRKKIVLVKAV
jgi:tyrosyl-tRNA synthetase